MVMPGHGDAEAGFERGVARDVVPGGALGQAAADDDVLDLRRRRCRARVTACAEHVRGHRDAVGLVERAAPAHARSRFGSKR